MTIGFYLYNHIIFIDDYSICTWVYFLKIMTKVFDMFLAYKALVEKQ